MSDRARRLLVVTPRELTRDVRARREVEAAAAAGMTVVGLSGSLHGEEPVPLPGVEITRVSGGRVSGGFRRLGLGGMRRSRPPVRELRGLWRLVRLAKTTLLLTKAGTRLGKVDVVHVNDLDALPAGYLVARRAGARLVYDAHELYRYMEADPPRIYTAAASAVEGWIGRRAGAVVTNCDLFALELERLLHLRRPPLVVLNCPDVVGDEPAPRADSSRLRVVYQAAADHEGRPVADLLDAAAAAPDVDVTIRLVDVDRAALEADIEARGLADRVRLAEAVAPDRLVEGLAGFDAGVILNREVTPNVALAVPGKLWEYMMAGLVTVAPASPGLRIVDELGVGLTFAAGRPAEMGERLAWLAANRGSLEEMAGRARALALSRYNSAAQASVLRAAWALTGAD